MTARRTVVSLILLAYVISVATPAYADRVETRHITQVFTGAQNVPDLQLRGLYNDNLPHSEFQFPPVPRDEFPQPYFETIVPMDLSSLTLPQDPKNAPVGDVEVAICDCGDLFVPIAGGFPKWPLLFLAGIPLAFIKGGEDELPPIFQPTPPSGTPTTQQVPVPEPTSLLLLLTGACAVGLRLRKSKPWAKRDEKNDDV